MNMYYTTVHADGDSDKYTSFSAGYNISAISVAYTIVLYPLLGIIIVISGAYIRLCYKNSYNKLI